MNRVGFGQSSFALNSLGLRLSTPVASGPKLQADFTTGTYKASGANKTFADLFTFTRAGKAWLVKETGLQEYAADVPRFDNGLLIEQESTNLIVNSDFSSESDYRLFGAATYVSNGVLFPVDTTPSSVYQNIQTELGVSYTTRVWLNKSTIFQPKAGFEAQLMGANKQDFQPVGAENHSYYAVVVATNTTSNNGVRRATEGTDYSTAFTVKKIQVEQSSYPSSFIPTATTPVTRPADYLLNKITGTTVTGDWDSTLNLSIVAGKLVHSGYGRIRSLEIN